MKIVSKIFLSLAIISSYQTLACNPSLVFEYEQRDDTYMAIGTIERTNDIESDKRKALKNAIEELSFQIQSKTNVLATHFLTKGAEKSDEIFAQISTITSELALKNISIDQFVHSPKFCSAQIKVSILKKDAAEALALLSNEDTYQDALYWLMTKSINTRAAYAYYLHYQKNGYFRNEAELHYKDLSPIIIKQPSDITLEKVYKELIKKGSITAGYYLALNIYSLTDFSKESRKMGYSQVYHYALKSAERGYKPAFMLIGDLFLFGWNGEKDLEKAKLIYLSLLKENFESALIRLAQIAIYESDLKAAEYWLAKSVVAKVDGADLLYKVFKLIPEGVSQIVTHEDKEAIRCIVMPKLLDIAVENKLKGRPIDSVVSTVQKENVFYELFLSLHKLVYTHSEQHLKDDKYRDSLRYLTDKKYCS